MGSGLLRSPPSINGFKRKGFEQDEVGGVNNLLSSEEVKRYLELEDQDLNGLIELGKLQAYKIGGSYLRFRKEDVLNLKQEFHATRQTPRSASWLPRLWDFWRFNNFYILSLFLIAVLFFFVIRS